MAKGNGIHKIGERYTTESGVKMMVGQNGKSFAPIDSVDGALHITDGNSKTGTQYTGTYNFPIEYTCDHSCECYKEGLCYAAGGCYNFPSNQQSYTENLKFFMNCSSEQFVTFICYDITANKYKLFRWFTCGDIYNMRFFLCMLEVARRLPAVKFWAYTKKYSIVNKYCEKFGVDSIPENLTIIYSHWLNKNGTYHKMENPYDFPKSEFIPIGREELAKTVTHVCPCSDPSVLATCETCEHACYTLQHGESMALLEHSTSATKSRDREIKAAKKALEEKEKSKRKGKKSA